MPSASAHPTKPHALALRPYQRECIEQVRAAYRHGRRRVLVSLPTGTGKTVVFVSFVRAFHMKKKLLVLAHRDELLEQARDKLAQHVPDASVTIEQGSRRADPNAQVVIASVPTLGRANSPRLAALDPGDFSIVVVDEAHHAVATTYQRILNHFGVFEPGTSRLLVGFTATPRRGDGQGLGKVFEEITYARGIEEMIRDRWLCDVSGLRVTTDIDLDHVRVRHGDFVESQLARAVNVKARNDTVLDAYRRYASGRRAIVFCVDVAHAHAMAETISGAGIAAHAVSGEMPRDDRRAVLQAFRNGTISVLTNCNVLTEGFDEPSVACVIMARPTKSRLLYAQMIGRGTRLYEGKPNLLVIDVADNSREHTLAGIHHVFDLPDDLNLEGRDALTVADALRRISKAWPWIDASAIGDASDVAMLEQAREGDAAARQTIAERFWLFSFEPPAAVRDFTEFAWHATAGGDYALDVGNERLVATRTLLDEWILLRLAPGVREPMYRASRLDEIIRTADSWVKAERTDKVALVSQFAGWRHLAPSDKQRQFLDKRRVPTPKSLTRGQASRMISHLSAPRTAR